MKFQLTKTADVSAKVAANRLAAALRADVIQVIGRTATLFRENPDLVRKNGAPPWRTA